MKSAGVVELDTSPVISSSPTVEGEGIKLLEHFERELPFNRPTLTDQVRLKLEIM